MKKFLRIALTVCLAVSLAFGLFACGGDKGGNNGQEQTTPTGDNGSGSGNNSGDEAITVETGDNELPLIPIE